jgi:tRNA threonylcarbamoyl adenosine modification protein (Sua5/YciO/YrdC/YwlC family)
MTVRYEVHPVDPQPRLLRQAAEMVRAGQLLAMPTDACYVLACRLGDKAAVDRLRALRNLGDKHLLTLMCADLSQLAVYAQVDNRQFRFLKEVTPGPYTFILPATKETPRRLWHPSRRTIGLRVPDSRIALGVLEALGEPVLCTSLILPGETDPLHEADEIIERVGKQLDAVIDAGGQGFEPTTMVDMTGPEPVVVRTGRGSVERVAG